MRDLLRYQNDYKNQPYEKFQVYFRKRKLIEILHKYNFENLLEIGCGLESIFLDVVGFKKLYVVEPAEMFYLKAIKDSKVRNLNNIYFLNATIQNSIKELTDIKFDFILVSSLLHEIERPIDFLNQIRKLCNKDTIVHINVPNAHSFHRILAKESGIIKDIAEKSESNLLFQQATVFTIDSLKKIANDTGFEIIDSGSYSFKPFTHGQMQKIIDFGILDEKVIHGLYEMEKYFPFYGSEIFINIKLNYFEKV